MSHVSSHPRSRAVSNTTKIIQLSVPISYQVPAELQNSSPLTIAAALDLAAAAIQQVDTKTVQITNESLYQELRQQASIDFEQQSRKLKQQVIDAESIHSSLRVQLAELQQAITQIRQEERDKSRELLADKDSQIMELRGQLRESSVRILDSFQSLRQDWTRHAALAQAQAQAQAQSQNSSIKGRQAETVLSELLIQVFSPTQNGEEFNVATTAKEAYAADIQMVWKNSRVLWESKNYKDQVNSKEVQKFKRDLELNKEFALGVMVSFHSGIAGHIKSGNIDIEVLPDSRIAIYISNLSESNQDPITTLQSLRPFFEIILSYERRRAQSNMENLIGNNNDCGKDNKYEMESLRLRQNSMEISLGIFTVMCNKHIKSLTDMRNHINVWQKKQTQMFNEFHASVREQEQYAKQILEEILLSQQKFQDNESVGISAAIGENIIEDATDEQSTHSLVLDTLVYTNTSLNEYDPREKKFIGDILKLAVVKEDSKISAKELKEKLVGWSESAINSLRGKVFQPGVWDSGSKIIRHLSFRQTNI